jgi:NAD(P)-dependent dehydrogenase (short-subunit alcohol dehydrogenase family)
MWEKQAADYGKKRNLREDEVMDYFREKIPVHRIGTVEDIAKLVVFLSTSDSDYITGQALNVNGGDYMA